MRMFLSAHIDASQEAVFAVASDFSSAPGVIDGIHSVEMLCPATDGSAIGVGTRFKQNTHDV